MPRTEINGKQVSVLIAAYNEEKNIGGAIDRIKRNLPHAEIIVVDDGSGDQTLNEAKQFEDESVKVFSIPHQGKGAAIKKAIAESTRNFMVQIDADLQFPAKAIPLLIDPLLENKADIIFGSRYLAGSTIEKGSISFLKRIASFVIGVVISLICGRRYTDVFAGLKAWKKDVINQINIKEPGFAYEAEIAIKAKRHGYSIIEVPIHYNRRIAGKSKINFLHHSITIPWRIIYIFFLSRFAK